MSNVIIIIDDPDNDDVAKPPKATAMMTHSGSRGSR